jgi:hypothetical protein
MKTNKNEKRQEGKLMNGIFKEYFKAGSWPCEYYFGKGEKQEILFGNGRLTAIGSYANDKMNGK